MSSRSSSRSKGRWAARIGRITVVATLLAVAGFVAVGPAREALAVPAFQMPIPCGQQWTTSTHGGHASQYMVDMINANGSTQGTPALASAGGTVTTSTYSDSGGNMIVIDHGGGWTTRYLHLDSRSVGVGQNVGIGAQIGTVGNTGDSTGAHLHYEQKFNGSVVQAMVNGHYIPVTWSYYEHYETSNNCGGDPPPPPPGTYWVDTFDNANVYASPTSTDPTGTLYGGTNYVFCKEWGREIRFGSSYNHWWLRTDPDEGPANQYVSAYMLTHWGNDEARDNNGTVIPDC